MKHLFALAFLLFSFIKGQSQIPDSTWIEDTLGFSYLSLCRLDTTLVKPGQAWPEATFNDDVCKVPDGMRKIPPGKMGLVIPYNGGDCHAWHTHHYSWDEAEKKLIYHLVNHYGGCRAGGRFFVRFTHLPALPKGYTFEVKHHWVDDRYK